MSDDSHQRIAERMRVIDREAALLADVRDRLSRGKPIDEKRVETLTATGEGRDMLESFASKFARFQDMLVDKLLRDVLAAAGEVPVAAIDNLNKAEQFGWIDHAHEWIAIRGLRNMLVHEYIEDLGELANNLERARVFTSQMLDAHRSITQYARQRLAVNTNAE